MSNNPIQTEREQLMQRALERYCDSVRETNARAEVLAEFYDIGCDSISGDELWKHLTGRHLWETE